MASESAESADAGFSSPTTSLFVLLLLTALLTLAIGDAPPINVR
jgi:hypothetical protein